MAKQDVEVSLMIVCLSDDGPLLDESNDALVVFTFGTNQPVCFISFSHWESDPAIVGLFLKGKECIYILIEFNKNWGFFLLDISESFFYWLNLK